MDGSIVVSALVKIVGEKLGSSALKELGFLLGVKNDLEELERTTSKIRDVLDDAEECCLKNKQVYNWLRELKDVVYDAEDLLDEIYLEAERRKTESCGRTSRVIRDFVCTANPIKRLKLGHKIKLISERLNTISAEKAKFHFQSLVVGSTEETCNKNRETSSKVDEDSICGRESEREKIITQLKKIDEKENISVISIVGLGGVGKTTLAKLVYNNDDELKAYFDYKIWIYVSRDFNVRNIMRDMIESLLASKCRLKNLDVLVEELTKQLNRKRFLLVLDDIWNEDVVEWENLKVVLKFCAFGSKIITTTRSMKVSHIMKSTYTFKLEGLSKEMSWTLFNQNAFTRPEIELNSYILEIAKEIASKCGGVPLALKTLGSTMQFNNSVEEWLAARDSDIWKIDGVDRVIASLMLSYINLPSHLKECFLYCSIFPKGHVILKEDLIDQWIAHGFVALMEAHKGNKYFEQLVQISFLQNVDETTNEPVKCTMHDLVHYLAQSIVAGEFPIKKFTNAVTNENVGRRYIPLINFIGKVERTVIEKVRALHVVGGDSSVINIVSKAKLLRSLVLDMVVSDTFSLCISNFIHLRYLCISKCEFTVIPEDIGALWNLQTLHLRHCDKITYIPKSIGKVASLRTLEIVLWNLKSLPKSIGQCQSLQNLIVNSKQIETIPNSIGHVNIRSLNFSYCTKLKRVPFNAFEQFHSTRIINFIGCVELEEVPVSIGSIVNLEVLNLSGCTKLICLPESTSNLRNLRIMNLNDCQNLEELPFSIGNLVNLESLNMSRCTRLKCLPHSAGNLNNLRIMNLEWSGIETIPSSICKLKNLTTLNVYSRTLSGMPIGIGNLTSLRELSLFHQGREHVYACISELEHLNFLGGDLEISGLENLNNPREIAQIKYLKEKTNLDKLTLMWNTTAIPNDSFESYFLVLESLQPPSSIKSLKLEGYPGRNYRNWMTSVGVTNATYFSNLTNLNLSRLIRCSNLPLPEMPHLRNLFLYLIESLTNFSGHFPSLIELYLYQMSNLEVLVTMNLGANKVYKPAFPLLSKLEIMDCPKLRMRPHLPPSVVELKLERSNEELLAEVELPDGESSQICSSSLGVKELSVGGVKSSTEWVLLKQLSSLEVLKFRECELNCLPKSMRYLSCLCVLDISSCYSLHVLPGWLWELKSLKHLKILNTPVRCLSESMQQLAGLKTLEIYGCPVLERTYEREKWEDWQSNKK